VIDPLWGVEKSVYFYIFALDFSTLIFGLILRVGKFGSKSAYFSEFSQKNTKKREKTRKNAHF